MKKTPTPIKENIGSPTENYYNKYKVVRTFILEGNVINPSQAILLTDAQAKEFKSSIELI